MKKRVDKLFMENPKIYCGWLDLDINNDIVIPVSYLNSRFFYDLLNIVSVLGNCSMAANKLLLEIDCEGTLATLEFQFFNDSYIPDGIYDYERVYVTVTKEYLDSNREEQLWKKQYEIDRYTLIYELLELVESNYEKYNTDFCCDDVADTISLEYINIVKDNLGWKYQEKN